MRINASRSADRNFNQRSERGRRLFSAFASVAALLVSTTPFSCSSTASSTLETVEGETGGASGNGKGSFTAGASAEASSGGGQNAEASGGSDNIGNGGEAGAPAGTAGTSGDSGAAGQGGDGTAGSAGAGGTPDADCASRTVSDTAGIFVEASTGADVATCGDREKPCKTVQQGVSRAATLGKKLVYVSVGTYVETVTLKPDIRVEGAWGAVNKTWSPICTAEANQQVVIQAPTSSNKTIIADDIKGAELARLSIRSKASANPGESLYGVFARGKNTTLVLDAVSIDVANAGAGNEGTKGTNAAQVTGSCAPGDGSTPSSNGAMGDGAPAGAFNADGYIASDGSKGKLGTRGSNGKLDTAECIDCQTCNTSCSPSSSGATSCGSAGKAGCGGNVPEGGNPGKGGGSSIGVYVWDATLVVTNSAVRSGDAGNGRKGGASGDRGIGSAGELGGSGSACATDCSWVLVEKTCCVPCNEPELPRDLASSGSAINTLADGKLMSAPQPLAPVKCCEDCSFERCDARTSRPSGGRGYQGGSSSLSGEGGGGAGGSSFAIYKNANAQVNQTNTILRFGKAGASATNGAAGKAAAINP